MTAAMYGGAGLSPFAAASPQARTDIPATYLALYQAAATNCPGLSWAVLAGIGKIESDHGRSPLPGVHQGANYAGAQVISGSAAGIEAREGRGRHATSR